jgi:hypothetical protein
LSDDEEQVTANPLRGMTERKARAKQKRLATAKAGASLFGFEAG